MASFFRQLSRGAHNFGRQLGRDVSWFGRQLSTGSRKVGQGIGKAQNVVSSIEKITKNIPVVGDVTHLAGVGLKGLHNVADMGNTAGQGLNQLGQGHLKDALNSGKQLYSQGQSTVGLGGDLVKAGLPLMAFM